MTSIEEQLLLALKEKVGALAQKIGQLETEKRSLLQNKLDLVKRIEEQDKVITDLEFRYRNLEVAKSIASSDGEREAVKQRIDFLIDEIDTCISLLND